MVCLRLLVAVNELSKLIRDERYKINAASIAARSIGQQVFQAGAGEILISYGYMPFMTPGLSTCSSFSF